MLIAAALALVLAAPTINVIRNVDARPVEITCREGEAVPVMEYGGITNYYCEDVARVLERGQGGARLATAAEVTAEQDRRFARIDAEVEVEQAAERRKEYWMIGGVVGGAFVLLGLVNLHTRWQRRKKAP